MKDKYLDSGDWYTIILSIKENRKMFPIRQKMILNKIENMAIYSPIIKKAMELYAEDFKNKPDPQFRLSNGFKL